MTAHAFNDAAPTLEEIAAGFAGLMPPPGVPVPIGASPAPERAPEPHPDRASEASPAPRWLTEKKRIAAYDLEYPFELGGVEYRTITIKRLTAGEVASFMRKMRAEPDVDHRFPLYFVNGEPIPDAAWDAMMDDDRFAVTRIWTDFLPERFRAAPVA